MADRAPSSRRSHLFRAALLLAFGVALLWTLVVLVGEQEVRAALLGADRRLLGVALALFLTQSVTLGLRWWAAMRLCGYRVRLTAAIRATAVCNTVNFFAPGHFGEPLAGAWLGSTGRAQGVEAFALLVASKAVATVLNLVALLVCLPLLAARGTAGATTEAGVLVGLGVLLAAAAFGAILHPGVASWGTRVAGRLVRRVLGWTDRWRGGGQEPGPLRSERLGVKVESIFARFRDSFTLFARHPGALAVVAALSTVKVVVLIGSIALVYAAIGNPVSASGATFLMSVDGLGNLASIWIPGNLGLQELVHTTAASKGLVIDPAIAVSAAILVKALMLAHGAFCGLLWLGLEPFDPPSAP